MTDAASKQQPSNKSLYLRLALGIAIALCIVCCTLILMIPTESINVDTVYQGF